MTDYKFLGDDKCSEEDGDGRNYSERPLEYLRGCIRRGASDAFSQGISKEEVVQVAMDKIDEAWRESARENPSESHRKMFEDLRNALVEHRDCPTTEKTAAEIDRFIRKKAQSTLQQHG